VSGFDGENTAPAVAMLMACAVLDVDRLADQDPGRCAVVASALPALPGERLIERRAIALVQLQALLRQLLKLACARAYRPHFGAEPRSCCALRCTSSSWLTSISTAGASVASAVRAPPGDRPIERRAIALAQLPALLRQLLQLARARLAAAARHRRWPCWWPAALHVEQLASLDIGRCALTPGAVPVCSGAAPSAHALRVMLPAKASRAFSWRIAF